MTRADENTSLKQPSNGSPTAPVSAAQWGFGAAVFVGVCLILVAMKRQGRSEGARAPLTRGAGPGAEMVHGEMQQMTRALIDELDNKSRELERLIAKADQRIQLLSEQAVPPEPPPQVDPLVEPKDPLRSRVHQLSDSGRTPVEIAQALGCHTGQVELMLALRRAGQ